MQNRGRVCLVRTGFWAIAAAALAAGPLLTATAAESPTLEAELKGKFVAESDRPLSARLSLTNQADAPAQVKVELSVQRDPALYDLQPPDAQWGTDHALGARSWTEIEGKKVEEGSLTDGDDTTMAQSPWQTGHFTEGFQFVDLGQQRQVSHLRFTAGDANWYHKVDISASLDGKTYTPVEGLQGLDWYQKWGRRELNVAQPFAARCIRLRYHNDGKKLDVIRTVAGLSVYDGVEDETMAIPAVGAIQASVKTSVVVQPHATLNVPLSPVPVGPGSYFVAARLESGGRAQLVQEHYFIMPPAMPKVSPDSRFGLNVGGSGLAAMNRRLGIGWTRFENMKWPMLSSERGVYHFEGAIAPWNMNVDKILEDHAAQGISVLPYLFLSPSYLGKGWTYPPSDITLYGEFAFQTAARYGAVKHPAEALKTPDKKSGLGLIKTYELWNEPNLDNPDWGHWKGPIGQYYELFRIGAEGIKQADPSARVCNGGYAGLTLDLVDQLRTYKYKDGKCPLDFVDVLSVHDYTGKTAPELATVNTNIDRSGNSKGQRTFEDDLRNVVAWRDQYKPGMPIWLTETGYDSAGNQGVTERLQAAYLVRDVMLVLASGIEKVLVYRESGSKPTLWGGAGVVRNDNSLKPSWFTYATLIRQLEGATEGKRVPVADPNVRLYVWRCGQRTVLTAWAIKDTGKLPLKLGLCTVTDAFGAAIKEKIDGEVALSMFPLYISDAADAAAVEALYQQAARQEQADHELRTRQSALRAYLFTFGGKDQGATVDIGRERPCTSLGSADTWDAAKGYGFEPRAGLKDESRNWITDKMERGMTRIGPEVHFRLHAEPGRYRLCIKAAPFGGPAKLTIQGAVGEAKVLSASGKEAAEVDLEVGADDLLITSSGYADVTWLTLVEKL